jgi:exopolysaccharide biosynthesis polyprenyl glycosylphosphotransferase
VTRRHPLLGVCLAGDLACAGAAIFGAFWLRLNLPLPFTADLLPEDRLRFLRDLWWVPIALQPVALYFFGLYESRQPLPRIEVLRRLTLALAVQSAALLAWIFLTNRTFPRSVFVLHGLIDLGLLAVWRFWFQRLRREGARRVIVVGSGEEARELAARIAEHGWHGLAVVGHVPAPGDEPAAPDGPLGPCVGRLEDLPRLLREGAADTLVLTSPQRSWQTALVDELAQGRPDGTSVLLLPGPFESLIGQMRFRWVRDIPLVDVVGDSAWRLNQPLKRALDLVAAALLFVATAPLLLAAVLLVKATSRGPVLYPQTRVGRDRRPFTLWKLRTMRPDAEADGVEVLAEPGDPRLTPVGAWLRRTRLDELPQIWNVLAGSMSLVGPRPERPGFTERNLRAVPGYAERFVVAPGITGLAQVNGEYHTTAANKLRYDLAYIANWSVWLDLSILLKTVRIVLTSRGV